MVPDTVSGAIFLKSVVPCMTYFMQVYTEQIQDVEITLTTWVIFDSQSFKSGAYRTRVLGCWSIAKIQQLIINLALAAVHYENILGLIKFVKFML